ncbi:MAG: uroporphyrinogen-III C-methyltransferase [Zetaproteobacteria bacterium CG_4_9_14_3_um_filter_53_7]|nr:MAG: uroporphyrinogen-III C-methyltransferase [Zetaproteobacteria bacterium CG1_02_53_45]PJA31097.1 MAG: uroporphyrinogen-III C-methyltransferase [Zetaproteobacteria bacterium CG_4_9_14_3_um_filter_53_7]
MKLDAPLITGEVALVGAGPGDACLLTLAAAKLIGDCDVIVYDALVSEDVLNLAAVGAELILAGKRGGRPSASQLDICETLIELANEGKRVVRLKGGDPFVFGRGGEEMRALATAGIRFRIIPGITAGVAAPAMAGIPVTDRSVNGSLAFLTGHEASEKSRMDWKALVEAFPVLVFYMGAKNLPQIAARLLDAGLAQQTPLAIIHAATLAEESTTIATLEQAANGSVSARSPSILIIGDVVSKRISWKD